MQLVTKARIAPTAPAVGRVITSTSLKDRAVAIKSEVAALVAARSALSLAVIEQDAEAIAAQAEIDVKRNSLLSELETVEAAIPELQQRERELKQSQICLLKLGRPAHVIEQLKSRLRSIVVERRILMLRSMQHGLLNERQRRPHEVHAALADIDPVAIARELVQPLVKQVVTDNDEIRGMLKAERNQIVDRLARELVENTKLPSLPAEIAKLEGA